MRQNVKKQAKKKTAQRYHNKQSKLQRKCNIVLPFLSNFEKRKRENTKLLEKLSEAFLYNSEIDVTLVDLDKEQL